MDIKIKANRPAGNYMRVIRNIILRFSNLVLRLISLIFTDTTKRNPTIITSARGCNILPQIKNNDLR